MQRALALLALALLPAVALAAAPIGVSSPLLIWSNKEVVGKGSGQHVSYQTISNAEALTSEVVLGAAGKGDAAGLASKVLNLDAVEAGSTVVVYLGSQLDVSDMRRGAASTKLGGVLDAAASSMVLPYASSKAAISQDALVTKLSAAGLKSQVIGCAGAESNIADALAQAKEGNVQVLLVCSRVPESDESTSAGLEAELTQLEELQQAVQESGLAHVFVYASVPRVTKESVSGGKRRSLLQSGGANFVGFGPYTQCGPLCQTQVRWLEGILAILFLALASCAGLTCLYVLDTPTRFETPKEGQ